MKKSDIDKLPKYFDYYITINKDIELNEAFSNSLKQIENLEVAQFERIGLRAYEDGKWSINEIIQHISDWERIWCYRTLLAVRNEGTIPSGLDHNLIANNCNANEVAIEHLINELYAVRKATVALFNTFDKALLLSNCKFSDNEMSILAMGFNIVGHQQHHFKIISERYLPLDA